MLESGTQAGQSSSINFCLDFVCRISEGFAKSAWPPNNSRKHSHEVKAYHVLCIDVRKTAICAIELKPIKIQKSHAGLKVVATLLKQWYMT